MRGAIRPSGSGTPCRTYNHSRLYERKGGSLHSRTAGETGWAVRPSSSGVSPSCTGGQRVDENVARSEGHRVPPAHSSRAEAGGSTPTVGQWNFQEVARSCWLSWGPGRLCNRPV